MSRQKYEGINDYKKSVLINYLIVNSIILLVLLSFGVLYLKPLNEELSTKKETLMTNISQYENIKKNGVDYTTFKSLVPSNNKNLKNIVDKVGQDFFNTSLKNTSNGDYIAFLNTKKSYVNELKKSDLVKKRDEKISTVLPFYTPGMDLDGSITDLGFTNYLETLLKTFSIRSNSQIGLGEVFPLESKDSKDKNQALGSEIFYTDTYLELEGRKSDILDFLYFAQNVGNISIENINNTQDVVFQKDSYLNKVMVGETPTSDYNINQNKFMDITSITFSKYLDDSSNLRPENQKTPEGFINFIKTNSDNGEPYTVSVKLRFYFRGLPTYKIEVFVQSVIEEYNNLNKDIKQSISKSQNRDLVKVNSSMINVINNFKNIDTYLTTNQDKLKKLQTGIAKKDNLDLLYKDAIEFKNDLDSLEAVYQKGKQELDKTLNVKK